LYEKNAQSVDFTDGLSVEFADWRFNLRGSNTEPLVRLNVESRGNEALMREKTPIGVLSLLFGYLRQRHGSLWPSVLAHALHNALTLLWSRLMLF
ncbi:MAG: CPBP family intramembrane metalloprotease, partial [Akkermansiaceae bacterium]|nr:CPBP family intramembrane metalloprotease [Akkermansiaceae bacterium]